VQDETIGSFIHRLARANHIRDQELVEYLNPEMAGLSRRRFKVSLDAVAAVSGIDAVHLAYALPDLRSQFVMQDSLHVLGRPIAGNPNKARLACRRCVAAKNITTRVRIWARHDQNVCPRHQLWISEGVRDYEDQADVADFPEITRAQLRHRDLIRRHGHRRIRNFYGVAQEVVDWSSNLPSPTARWERKQLFFSRANVKSLPWSYDYASYYPEVVGVLSVLASPYWRRIALSDDLAEQERFYRQVADNGLTNGKPSRNRPLADWLQDRHERKTADDPDGEKTMERWYYGHTGVVEPHDDQAQGDRRRHLKLPQIMWQATQAASAT